MWDVSTTQGNACKPQAGKPIENTLSNPFIKWAFYIPGREFTRKMISDEKSKVCLLYISIMANDVRVNQYKGPQVFDQSQCAQ